MGDDEQEKPPLGPENDKRESGLTEGHAEAGTAEQDEIVVDWEGKDDPRCPLVGILPWRIRGDYGHADDLFDFAELELQKAMGWCVLLSTSLKVYQALTGSFLALPIATAIVSAFTFISPVSSSMVAPATGQISQQFHITNSTEAALTVSVSLG
jgi:hypothetical protein